MNQIKKMVEVQIIDAYCEVLEAEVSKGDLRKARKLARREGKLFRNRIGVQDLCPIHRSWLEPALPGGKVGWATFGEVAYAISLGGRVA